MQQLANTVRFIYSHPLNRDAKFKALRRYVGWQIQSRLRDEIVVPWIGNAKLAVRRGMTGATGNIYCGLHEFCDMAFLLHFLRPEDCFIDAGANVGSYTVLASAVVGASSLSIEPGEGALQGLRRNIEVNGIEDKVAIAPCAVGASERELMFTTGLDTMNRAALDDEIGTRIVLQKTLDSVAKGFVPAMLKMDLEGHEEQAILGASEMLASPSLKAIETEANSTEITRSLTAFGFELS